MPIASLSTLSTTTTTYDLPSSPHSYSSTIPRSLITSDDDDDDQIVWNVSEGSHLAQLEDVVTSDQDFVVLVKPRSANLLASAEVEPFEQQTPISATKPLEIQMSTLSLSSKATAKKTKKFKRSKQVTLLPPQDMTTSRRRNNKSSAESPKHPNIPHVVSTIEQLGLGQRPIVDDLSEQVPDVSGNKTQTVYEEASTFISMFLSNPEAKTDNICRLTLLQSLIIELGLGTASALPLTLRAAKAFLKARAFLNIREYIAVRGQGPEAVQSVMYPSRSALIKSIKKKKNATSIKWVKELGLQALLVGYVH